ncbi:hypothetical protein B0T10DRAFT_609854 [Thelonectria olida]|uniref:Uncharacterized protein n=1 Tax=Thelonectria olida TaxID=1576542 RepID=A0A9P9AKJ0_9HYPO|nr:hypothetical protein B0T10DRAFT_609854 [Thelonectria olida]
MSTSRALVLVALLSGAFAEAKNATADEERIGWVAPDASRDTWDIIWSCLSIFIVCSWKCVHLNVPTHRESIAGWEKVCGIFYRPSHQLMMKWWRKLLWMFVIAIAPELGVSQAVRQWRMAREELDRVTPRRKRDPNKFKGQKFTMTHAFYVQMGGILLCEIPEGQPDQTAPAIAVTNPFEDPASEFIEHTERPRSYVLLRDQPNDGLEKMDPIPKVRLHARILDSLEMLDEIGVVPTLTEEDIQDRSRADSITKLFALVQCSWLVVQTIARGVKGLAISQLELATIAFVFCALVMHFFWWNKPFDVERRHVLIKVPKVGSRVRHIPNWDSNDIEEMGEWIAGGRKYDLAVGEFFEMGLMNLDIMEGSLDDSDSDLWPTVGLYATGAVFSAIHLAAWNWEFPSLAVKILWRVFGLIALSASFTPFVLFAAYRVANRVINTDVEDEKANRVAARLCCFTFLTYIIYFIARMVILVLTCYCMYNMPASTYEKVAWTAWIPHFG